MPLRHIDETDTDYHLVLFDSDGVEVPEADGSLYSRTLADLAGSYTDIFLTSHGWKGDVPAAIRQYDKWIATMVRCPDDLGLARAADPGFRPLVIGVHWPSLPWGRESSGAAVLGDEPVDDFDGDGELSASELVDDYAQRLSDTPESRAALETIVAAANDPATAERAATGDLDVELNAAYATLFAATGLGTAGATGAPGEDQDRFDAAATIDEWSTALNAADVPSAGPGLLGSGLLDKARDLALSPLRQMSFWAMKHRARHVGETGVHDLIAALMDAGTARVHLMGHSFGCIVMTAAAAGPVRGGALDNPLPRPVATLFLVQGAMSLWSFADEIPYPPEVPGYFRPTRDEPPTVSGAVVTTRSSHDHAVGWLFPLGARAGRDRLLGVDGLPEFGGVGTYGIQGVPLAQDLTMLGIDGQYGLQSGTVLNVEASSIICHGKGFSGAHSDIAHPEVAHLFWQAALAAIRST